MGLAAAVGEGKVVKAGQQAGGPRHRAQRPAYHQAGACSGRVSVPHHHAQLAERVLALMPHDRVDRGKVAEQVGILEGREVAADADMAPVTERAQVGGDPQQLPGP